MHTFESSCKMMNILMTSIFCLYIHSYSFGAYGQLVNLSSTTSSETTSTCINGLRDQQDMYTVRGVVDATTGSVSQLATFQLKTAKSLDFVLICTLGLVGCSNTSIQSCYCSSNTSNTFEIVLNRTAILNDSNALIRIRWANASYSIVSKSEFKVPTIYDLNAVSSLLTVNDVPVICPINITYSSKIKYQCQNSPSPCLIKMTLDNTEVASNNDSVTYEVPTSVLSNVSHELAFSYSVCGGMVATGASCIINIEAVPTDLTTTAPSTCSRECDNWAIAFSVIFYLLIMVVLATGIARIVFIIMTQKAITVYLCSIVFVSAEIIDVILICVFAKVEYCHCDPPPGSNLLSLWKIMLIIFCVCNGLLFFAAAGVIISQSTCCNKRNANVDLTGSEAPIKCNKTTTDENTTPKSGHNKITPTVITDSGKVKEAFPLQEEKNIVDDYTNEISKSDKTEKQIKDKSEVRKQRQKKLKNKSKGKKQGDFEKGIFPTMSSPQNINTVSDDKNNQYVIT